MSEESIENITKSSSNFAPTVVDHHVLPDMNFNGQCLMKNNISIPKKVTNLYMSYTLGPQLRNSNTEFTLNINYRTVPSTIWPIFSEFLILITKYYF